MKQLVFAFTVVWAFALGWTAGHNGGSAWFIAWYAGGVFLAVGAVVVFDLWWRKA